jgi:tetratricopeptide (TPR) repeat protein
MPVQNAACIGLAIPPLGIIGPGGHSIQFGTGLDPAEEMQMKSTMTAIGAALISTAFAAASAAAQGNYGAQPAPQQPTTTPAQPQAQDQPAATTGIQPKVSRKATKAIQELQAAVKANNAAEIPAKIEAANAAAETADDRYMIGVLRYQAAVNTKDDTARVAAIEAMLSSGFEAAPRGDLYGDLGAAYSRLKQNDRAMQAYQQALQLNPNNVTATAGVAEAMAAQGQTAQAVALLEKGIALQSAGGAKAPEPWYKRAVAVAYKANMPQAIDLSRKWVAAYPTKDAWQNALAIYQNLGQLDESRTLDLLRLKRAAGVLSAADYFNYADIAVRKGYAGEAKAVLEEGFAANVVKRSDSSFGQLYTLASQKSQGDRASLPAAPAASANARQTQNIGDAYFGYGDYAKAVEFYRAALTKEGADQNAINLHIGMALARQGDKAGAAAALNTVSGPNAELAKFWQLFASSNA